MVSVLPYAVQRTSISWVHDEYVCVLSVRNKITIQESILSTLVRLVHEEVAAFVFHKSRPMRKTGFAGVPREVFPGQRRGCREDWAEFCKISRRRVNLQVEGSCSDGRPSLC